MKKITKKQLTELKLSLEPTSNSKFELDGDISVNTGDMDELEDAISNAIQSGFDNIDTKTLSSKLESSVTTTPTSLENKIHIKKHLFEQLINERQI